MPKAASMEHEDRRRCFVVIKTLSLLPEPNRYSCGAALMNTYFVSTILRALPWFNDTFINLLLNSVKISNKTGACSALPLKKNIPGYG